MIFSKRKMSLIFVFGLVQLLSFNALAKDIVVSKEEEIKLIRNAKTWVKPAWIDENFNYSDDLNILQGPPAEGKDLLLTAPTVYCQVTPTSLEKTGGGKTNKFQCQLLKLENNRFEQLRKGDKEDQIKVKYDSPEVFTEVIATRLFWALGFPTDRMFSVKQVHCYGCTEHPFKDRRMDPPDSSTARIFGPVAIEKKMSGDAIVRQEIKKDGTVVTKEGWSFSKYIDELSTDPAVHSRQVAERDALRLLQVFIYNWDAKPENQRLVCVGERTEKTCLGEVFTITHDLGASFGSGFIKRSEGKLHLEDWSERKMWRSAKQCIANMGANATTALIMPKISERGRSLLARLLKGFIAGEAGKQRVLDLFRAAQIEKSGRGSAEQWAQAFINKANQIIYPAGVENPNFRCPLT